MKRRRDFHKGKAGGRIKKERGAVGGRKDYEAKAMRMASEEDIEHFANLIQTFLRKSAAKPVSRGELAAKCRGKGNAAYLCALRKLEQQGIIAEKKSGYTLMKHSGLIQAEIVRMNRSFGIAKAQEKGDEIFIPGKELFGALLGDVVLVQPSRQYREKKDGKVVRILQPSQMQIAGTLIENQGVPQFLPDTLCKFALQIENASDWTAHIGDKVLADVVKRGKRHSEHIVRVHTALGSAESAKACAKALALVSGIPMEFPQEVLAEADALEQRGITEEDCAGRLDLRQSPQPIFTIDGFDSKDLDDAVSICRTENGYQLGVHIADVSHYVTMDSALNQEAIRRGTSVYYADQVIPMLPTALSNGICSLNPNVDRLAFSALMELDQAGGILSYRFAKTIIRSAVKGVYREVNAVIAGTATEELEEKYAEVKPSLLLLNELRQVRLQARKKRGAPSIEAEESKFLLDENGICVEVCARVRAEGEELVEECMLLANEAAAKFGKAQHIPFVYRVHANPPEEKVARLSEALHRLDLSYEIPEDPKPMDYAKVLEAAADSPMKSAVHQIVLRSMSKADYETEPIGHFGLALADYTHFTSPIRRYPDLSIHHMMSRCLANQKSEIPPKYAALAAEAGSRTEQRAMQLERDCDERYRAEWAMQHLGEEFEGVISGITEYGVYVMLPNTAEGMIALDTLPEDTYEFDGYFTLRALTTGRHLMIGMPLKVQIARADINSGHIDLTCIS
ncbi:MAG: ribonuclease R [Oscillospiraceae bacterium]|nr:ribonuclease R [Oscillospiraceae bacterium]